ncbi:hypothetical protein SUGI_1139140 [Cryptomeria japonica]|nr:hypothetical protein SUGI_1139140 [Cryptomeria japonica]
MLICAILSGLTAYKVYRETFSWFQPENTSLRFQYAGVHNVLLYGKEPLQRRSSSDERLNIENLVLLPENQLLLLTRLPFMLSPKSDLECVFTGGIATQVIGIDYFDGRDAVRCGVPFSLPPLPLDVVLKDHRNLFSLQMTESRPLKWELMVYESIVTEKDVILFAKGINPRQGMNTPPGNLHCVFNNAVQTAVTVSVQEIFRCAHPPKHLRSKLSGAQISLKSSALQMPSVANYNPNRLVRKTGETKNAKKFLCACTMVFNAAKFMKEWIIYHSYLGVEEFFIYDNNSEDNLEEVINSLTGYSVSRRPWPWVKTQEAGFAHCALKAADKCEWMMFTDVDEFVFSHGWSDHESRNALQILLVNKTRESNSTLGQVSVNCRNFGPSNQTEHPAAGVTQGYTCRQRAEQRHKSIVLLEALSASLMNVIHHFELKDGYKSVALKSSEMVINHYKYQAWSEFKAKFRRRVSAYVADWKEEKNPASQDRAPGLGYQAVKPPLWEKKFCEVNDTSLLQFAAKVFSVKSGSLSLLQWQL